MSKQEHRVSVDNDKYTFVIPSDDYRVSILRHGEPWHGPQAEASNALGAIMAELDAARVVLQAARKTVAMHHEGLAPIGSLRDALDLHDRLVDTTQQPSPWCGAEYATRVDADKQEVTEAQQLFRTFIALDDAPTVEVLDALWNQLVGKLGDADSADAKRRYDRRKAWLES